MCISNILLLFFYFILNAISVPQIPLQVIPSYLYQKMCCTCRVDILLIKPIAFLLFVFILLNYYYKGN